MIVLGEEHGDVVRTSLSRARRPFSPLVFPANGAAARERQLFGLGHGVRGIVLVAPFDIDTAAVDRVTGGRGYGHAGLFVGEVDRTGRPVAIDSSITAGGVFRRLLADIVRDVRFVVVPVDCVERAYERAATRVGEPYHRGALLGQAPREGCSTCSHLVWSCLDRRDRARVTPWRKGWSVSPNDLHRAFAQTSAEALTGSTL